MDRKTAIEKIKKCLALSKSANEHEAAAALRHARALMEKFNVTDGDVLASDICETSAKAGATRTPSVWESNLAATACKAFGCRGLFRQGAGQWSFIGPAAAPEIAQYAFTVLLRQVKKERAAFIAANCKRLKPASKTRRADLFCDAWVEAVWCQVAEFAGADRNETAIQAYMDAKYASRGDLDPVSRNSDRSLREKDWEAISAGAAAGRQASLHRGVGSAAAPLALN